MASSTRARRVSLRECHDPAVGYEWLSTDPLILICRQPGCHVLHEDLRVKENASEEKTRAHSFAALVLRCLGPTERTQAKDDTRALRFVVPRIIARTFNRVRYWNLCLRQVVRHTGMRNVCGPQSWAAVCFLSATGSSDVWRLLRDSFKRVPARTPMGSLQENQRSVRWAMIWIVSKCNISVRL